MSVREVMMAGTAGGCGSAKYACLWRVVKSVLFPIGTTGDESMLLQAAAWLPGPLASAPGRTIGLIGVGVVGYLRIMQHQQ